MPADHSGPDRTHLDQWKYHHSGLELAAHLAQRHGMKWSPEQRRTLTRHLLYDLHVSAHQYDHAPIIVIDGRTHT